MPKSTKTLGFGIALSTFLIVVLYVLAQTIPGHNHMWNLPRFHFYIISATLILAAVSSITIGWTGIRLRDVSVLMLALALVSLTGFFLIHGLSTPGFIIDESYSLAGVSSQIAMTTCAIWILLSTVPSDHPFVQLISSHRRKVLLGWLGIIILVNVGALVYPEISEHIPVDVEPLNYAVGLVTVAIYIWAAKRYFTQFQWAQFPMHASVVLGAVLLSITECIMVTTMMWTIGWWLYHVVLVASTVTLLYGVVAQYKSNVSITQTVQQMFSLNPSERVRIGVSSSMKALITATETKDAYTSGHNFRVAMYALQLAETMGLNPELLRALVRGGLIHDVGKIQVPESILNKPGRLTPDERLVIEQHPVTGYEMCKYIGFMTEELSVIRHHHEKWDGTGYPDKLHGREISILARILAVADVYDALTSHRAYREPWSHDRAMQVIEEGSGTHFDPDCVKAWIQLCNSGRFTFPELAKPS